MNIQSLKKLLFNGPNWLLAILTTAGFSPLQAQRQSDITIDAAAQAIQSKCVGWRRLIHQNPELGNREFKTAKLIADHLRSLGIEVKEGVARTGVIGILKGAKPGPVIGLRADMDALPINEPEGLPFASKATAELEGQKVGVMHACGHDAHVAILMSVAEVLSGMKNKLNGTVKFIFQPAEEGAPKEEERGAALMIKEGALQNPDVDVLFCLHIVPKLEVGKIYYKPGGFYASATDMKITVKGKTGHAAFPWQAVDPVIPAAQIILALHTIVSRNLNITENAGVVSISVINTGVKTNIIPEQVELRGTIRALSNEDEKMIIDRIKTIASNTAEAAGTTAEIQIPFSHHTPATYNHETLSRMMLPSLEKAVGSENIVLRPAVMGAEDFSFFQQQVPGMYINIGGMPKGVDPKKVSGAHTPGFLIDESGMQTGIKVFLHLVMDYMRLIEKGFEKPIVSKS